MLVYLITNTIDGKRYVGQTSASIEQRWRQHKCDAKAGRGKYLYRSIRKHGFENFSIQPLIRCISKDEMDFWEIYLIGAWNLRDPEKGYNLTDGGEGVLGYVPSEETRALHSKLALESGRKPPSRKGCKNPPLTEEQRLRKSIAARNQVRQPTSEATKKLLSDINKGKTLSEEHKQKIAASHIGIRPTQETLQKMSESKKGIKQSDESKLKKSLATKGIPKSEETKQNMKDAWVIRRAKMAAEKAKLIDGSGTES